MKIISLYAKNFMSFHEVEYTFPESGLFFVGGEIHSRAISNSNGAGKSALFEALCWGLYGKTIRDTKVDNIINRSVGKNCVAGVVFQKGEDNYTIFRFRNDDENENEVRLMKNDKDITAGSLRDTQTVVDDALGMNWLVFSTAVIFGEMARRFTETTGAEKNKIFEDILMLQRFTEAQKIVKEDVKVLEAHRDTIESSLNVSIGIIGTYQDNVKHVNEKLGDLKVETKDVNKKIEEIKALINCQMKELESSEKLLEVKTKDITDLKLEEGYYYKALDTLLTEKRAGLQEAGELRGTLSTEAKAITVDINKIERLLGDTDQLKDGESCPLCGVVVTKDSMQDIVEYYKKERKTLTLKKSKAEKKFMYAGANYKNLEAGFDKKIDEATQLKNDCETLIGKLEKEVYNVGSTILSIERDISTKKAELTVLVGTKEADKKHLEERLKTLQKQIEDTQKHIDNYQAKILECNTEISYKTFWVEGFGNKGIKSFLLDEVLPELNTRANYYASMLLDNEVQIKFDTETTLKSGDTRDKFNVKIVCGNEEIDYNNYSSGEKARIDVAILLSLQTLVFNRSAGESNIIIFDEVFEHLDVVGIERTVSVLSEEADDKVIFVISHQNELRDYFDQQLLIIKDKNGVSRLGD